MARYTGPKIRLARKEGIDLGVKTPGSKAHSTLLKKLNVPPGQHGIKGRRKRSSFGIQLREKQKAKNLYGVLERQFRNYFTNALKIRGNTGEALLQQLERRLDNVLYRLALAPTRSAARQLVSHGHILVNDNKINIPSYQTKVNEVVSFKAKIFSIPLVQKQLEDKNPVVPAWLERSGPAGRVAKLPQRSDIDADINEQLIVEFYSR